MTLTPVPAQAARVVEVADPVGTVVVQQPGPRTVVEVVAPGPQGPPGAAVSGIDFLQASAALVWTIAHNLGHYPVVDVMTPGGVMILADVIHLSTNTLQVNFAVPTAGRARLV